MPAHHLLKTWPPYFDAVKRGEKNFEVRRDDRGFQKGDTVELRRYCPAHGAFPAHYDGAEPITRRITWILTGGQFGIEAGYVVLSLEPIT